MGNGTKTEVAIEISPSPSSEDGTPLRPIFCLKNKMDTKPFDDAYDCFILDFDQQDSPLNRISLSFHDDDDLAVVAEKGQVACRDYPHSRHLCVKFPFETTPHEKFCPLCYCYVCDLAAPCKLWKDPRSAHCHATGNVDAWKSERRSRRKQQSPPSSSSEWSS
ncbi:RPM1 interacting protein 13-like [Mercurialis annua]|uniref:RPM1 interacting protein 13-like n=1 Tax=Mercurialis annua TaxID=3986 RepID=UPI00215F0108|nr:RPM1 interacting protein 13-like [Mercurialis annua]